MILLAGILLQACQTGDGGSLKPMAGLPTAGAAAPAGQTTPAPSSPSRAATALFELQSEPIEFVKVRYNIPRGAQIGVSKALIARCKGAGGYVDEPLYWSEGRTTERDRELADAFFYAMSGAGLDVVGDPGRLFDEREERSRATMAVAAEITHLNLDVCDEVNWLDKRIGKLSGSSELQAIWHVYDKLERRVVLTTTTTGRAELKDLPGDDLKVFVTEAFGAAARALSQDQKFRRIVAKSGSGEAAEAGSGNAAHAELRLLRTAAFDGPLARRSDYARRATVTIDLGDGHGSGFVVDPRGFLLTNQHVVGQRERVLVRFFNGREVEGKVVRRDRLRDVALVKVADGDYAALPIRSAPAAVAEEVYAIGAPFDPQLSNTVTKGVVSALRRERNGMTYIQADVNIQSGNSGGPLLDQSGNVVGISTAGLRVGEAMAGVNFFIPIHDALDRLNLEIVKEPAA